jgi:hypothetical protein
MNRETSVAKRLGFFVFGYVAQRIRALRYERRGWEFESLRNHNICPRGGMVYTTVLETVSRGVSVRVRPRVPIYCPVA